MALPSTLSDERLMTKRVLWKLDIRILPSLALLWLASFLDRSNIGNAAVAGLRTDLHLKGNQFNAALSFFYITYVLAELPSNWIMKRLRPSRWLPGIVAAWGIVTTLSGLVQNLGGLIAIRLFLGVCEGGLLPGLILYLSGLYKREELTLRIGVFYASASLSGAFGGLLASVITKMDGIGGLAGWRWIFIIEGLATVVVAGFTARLLPSDIQTAIFLTEQERAFALRRLKLSHSFEYSVTEEIDHLRSTPPAGNYLKENEEDLKLEIQPSLENISSVEEEVFEWREVRRGIFSIQAWLIGLSAMCNLITLLSFSLFLPTILTGLGFKGTEVQLRSVPPYIPAVFLIILVALLSDRFSLRGPAVMLCCPISLIGYIMILIAKTNAIRYIAVFFIAAGIYPVAPPLLALIANNSSGHYKRATTTALQAMLGNCAGFIATFIYTSDQAPQYKRGHTIALAFVCLQFTLMACNVAYCHWENKARREGRRERNQLEYDELRRSGKTRAPIGDRSPQFMFSI
ncbi:hypothetical protein M422DRAFT_22923 [Sphaerobolus stellatus SS14]|nr:hypothetical protein M422DRAFT_22923 [Sphaerobolus stellatus SS14]